MSGRTLLAVMFVVVMSLSFVIYKVFQQSRDLQAMVSTRIEKSFNDFLSQAPATMKVAEASSPQGPVSYIENLKGAWRYQVDGGTLVAIAPVPTTDGTPSGKPLPPELRDEARKVLTEFVMGWARSHLKDTAKKDFVLTIKFADEPQEQSHSN